MTEPKRFAYESMGTRWQVTIWDAADSDVVADLEREVMAASKAFEQAYSRFMHTSLVWSLAKSAGVVEVPRDLVAMLRLYERLHELSEGKCNPLVGFALSDLGYDADYSLTAKPTVRPVPPMREGVRIVDDTHIEMLTPALIDVGAVGKGYFVDRIADMLRERGLSHFLVDGSGDVFYSGPEPIRAGLEDPRDPAKVIGVVTLPSGRSLCGSGSNRRRWGQSHHIIDPDSLTSPEQIVASWILAPTAALADGLATTLFLAAPEAFAAEWSFEYCLMNREGNVKRSAGFPAELF